MIPPYWHEPKARTDKHSCKQASGSILYPHLPPRSLLEVPALLNDAFVASSAAVHAQATGHISHSSTSILYSGVKQRHGSCLVNYLSQAYRSYHHIEPSLWDSGKMMKESDTVMCHLELNYW